MQNLDEPARIAAVQPDGRLIEHIQRADQPRSERRRQLNALRFAARERRGQTVKRQILEPDFVQKAQALLQFDKQPVGNRRLLRRKRELTEEARRLFHRHAANLADVLAVDLYLAGFSPQPSPAASGAQRVSAIAAEKNADVQLVFLALEMLKESANAAKPRPPSTSPNDEPLLFGVEFIPRHVQRNFGLPRKALQLGEQRPIFWFRPGLDRAFVQRLAFVGNDEVEIEINGVAKALAARTGAIRIVERKQPRLRLFVAAAIVLALEALRKTQPLRSFARAIAPDAAQFQK